MDRRYRTNVTRFGAPLPPGTPIQIHYWAGQPHVISKDGTPLGIVQVALNPGRAGLLRAEVARDVGQVDITHLGSADLSGE
jgi:hypothetical protein